MADRAARALAALLVATFAVLVPAARADALEIRHGRVIAPDHLRLTLSEPLARVTPDNFRIAESKAPDVPIPVLSAEAEPGNRVLLRLGERLDPAGAYRVSVLTPAATRSVHPAPWALFLSVILSSALINNFVFTRYLGLCIFFGVSKRRDTAIGMGITFTIVMILSAMLSWGIYTFVMSPLKLRFLQVIVFIGIVAFLVQALDTILKKTHRSLHQRWGVYLVLITTNCIILAVPLLNAAADAGPSESFALALGSGAGFALALFLMSCARERMELARVPAVWQGLPIAFLLAGLFALAFMGFSGLDFMR
ncbi:MAG: electron transport complex protein RnfA [Hyphomicrobiales bacterium]